MFRFMPNVQTFHVLTDAQYNELLHRLSIIEEQTKRPDEYLKQTDAARRANVSKSTICRWIQAGILTPKYVKGAKVARISLHELTKVIAQNS